MIRFTHLLVLGMLSVSCNCQGMQSMQGTPAFNLSTPQGIAAFLQMEGINPSQIITTNCVPNGNPCMPGGKVCCISPVMSCQPNPKGQGNLCMVVPTHRNHIPMIQQILQTANYTTPNPIQ